MTKWIVGLVLKGGELEQVVATANTPFAAMRAASMGHRFRDPRPIEQCVIVGFA